jgi:hypothetical protein
VGPGISIFVVSCKKPLSPNKVTRVRMGGQPQRSRVVYGQVSKSHTRQALFFCVVFKLISYDQNSEHLAKVGVHSRFVIAIREVEYAPCGLSILYSELCHCSQLDATSRWSLGCLYIQHPSDHPYDCTWLRTDQRTICRPSPSPAAWCRSA